MSITLERPCQASALRPGAVRATQSLTVLSALALHIACAGSDAADEGGPLDGTPLDGAPLDGLEIGALEQPISLPEAAGEGRGVAGIFAAGPRPLFQLPFPCGESWRLSTYHGHDDYDIDMTANSGSTNGRAIVASFGGTVSYAGWDDGGGWMVKINHGNGWRTLYLHMIESPMVSTGEAVAIGQQLGRVGSTGNSSGPHLHYEQTRDDEKVESWFDGQPSGITSDGDPNTGPLYIDDSPSASRNVVSNNCGTGPSGAASSNDVTGDGRADLVSAHGDGRAYVWPGRENGSFGTAVSSFEGTLDSANVDGTGHYLVGVADVTGDGRADLVSAHDDGSAYVWPGQTNGHFHTAVSSFQGTLDVANRDGSGHFIVGVSDVTGDGRADLVSAHDDGSAYVWPGRSDGHFGTAVSSFQGTLDVANLDASGHYIVGVSDVTGDGRADLVSAHDDGSAYVWPGRSDGHFGAAVSSFQGTLDAANLDGSGHYLVGSLDVTGDGRADLVSAHDDGSAYVWPGRSDGHFGTAVSSFQGTLDAANLDGSGHYLVSPATPLR